MMIGAGTSIGQTYVGTPWSALVNSASPWLLGGFVAGALQRTRTSAILSGVTACALEVITYYAVSAVRAFPVSRGEIVFWLVCALLGGPLFGWAGWLLRHGQRNLRLLGASLIPATFIAEGIGTYELRLGYHSAALLFGIIGVVLLTTALGVAQEAHQRLWIPAVATVVASAIGVLLYWQVLNGVTGRVFGV
jgi:hypothetical protein